MGVPIKRVVLSMLKKPPRLLLIQQVHIITVLAVELMAMLSAF
ncbi:putative dNA primase [Chlamydia psittaci 84-8471/1]|nr:putative dNA primase [Chlamydia psittaci 08-2626_L3]EPP30201.1 putative dNA primase [Chlamydia psittaci 84-8471/1]